MGKVSNKKTSSIGKAAVEKAAASAKYDGIKNCDLMLNFIDGKFTHMKDKEFTKFNSDADIIKWHNKTMRQYFNGPRDAPDVEKWKTANVFEEVAKKIIASRNKNRKVSKGVVLKKKHGVLQTFSKKRFYICLRCWDENRLYLYQITSFMICLF